MNVIGEDVTDSYRKGAEEALRLAELAGATIAIMKDKSPSCGLRTPYCEKPSGFGVGVTAALFELKGIKVFELGSSDTFPTPWFLKFFEKHN